LSYIRNVVIGCNSNLAVIKSAVYSQVVHVGVQHRCHLRFLHWAHFALGKHDEDGDVFLSSQSIYRRTACITTRSTNNRQMLPILAVLCLASVLADQEVFEQIAQKLKSHIFEGECGAVKKFKQVELLCLIEGNCRRDVLISERRVAACYDTFEVCWRNFGW